MAPEAPLKPTPISGIACLLIGVFLAALYFKGYRASGNGLALLQFGASVLCICWGVWLILFPPRRAAAGSRWSRWVPYSPSLTREGMIYLIIMITVFIGAMIGRSNLLLLVFGLLAGPFVINGYVTLTMLRKNALSRRSPDRVMVGEQFSVEILFTNRRWWLSSWTMVVQDRIQNVREVMQPRVLFTRVSPGERRSGRYHARLMERGRYTFGPLRLATRFPLGLVDRSLAINAPGEVLVHPRIGRLTAAWRREIAQADELVQQQQSRTGAFEDEFHRLREYRAGDNPRAIHWRTSARRNELMVREFHQNRDQDLTILLDLWAGSSRDAAAEERVELAVRFAATLCVEHCRQSRESQIFLGVAGDRNTQWTGPAGPLSITPLLDVLALAQAGPARDLAGLASSSLQFHSPRVRRVLVTTRPLDTGAAAELAPLQNEIRRRGLQQRTVTADPETLNRFCAWEV